MTENPPEQQQQQPENISAVAIKIPPFWPSDPQLWFAQVEAQFSVRGITREITRYQHVVSSLSPEAAGEVRDILIHPPEEQAYTKLKTTMLARLQESSQRRLQRLLTGEELGDRKPSQLLRRMQQLAGADAGEDVTNLVRELFRQRLPQNVRQILAGFTGSLEAEAQLADRILEQTPTNPHVASVEQNIDVKEIAAALQDLRLEISALKTTRQSREQSTRPSQYHHRQRSSSQKSRYRDDGKLCYYHFTFGKEARKCGKPTCPMANSVFPPNSEARY